MRLKVSYIWLTTFFAFLVLFASCSKEERLILSTEDVADNGNDDSNNEQTSDGEITLYRVNGETIEKIKDYNVSGENVNFQNDINKHQEIWELTKKIIPASHRHFMSEFMIYNGEVSGSAGYVSPTQSDLSKWQMGIAINYADNLRELTYTIIHEFGHILTLNNTQVDTTVSSNSCPNYHPGEGCAKTESYINKLHKNYWADIWAEFQQASDSESSHQDFYEKYKDRFVTNYAATNPGEDIAEVFAVFVTRNDKPLGNTIAENKILLLYQHNELVTLRNHIRANTQSRGKNGSLTLLPKPGSWKQANKLGTVSNSHCKLKH